MKSSQELFKSVQNFLYDSSLEIMLLNRLKNNENETLLISAEEIKKVVKLDEYFYRLMYEKSPNLPNSSLNKYLTEISRELKIQPLLLLELPMYKLDKSTLNYYLTNYNYIIIKINELETEANNIYRKFLISPNNITYQELSKLTKFFSYNLPNNYIKMYKAMEQVAKFLLNNQKDTSYNYIYTEFLIKFFGYKKIYEDKLNNTQIIIGKLNHTTYGESTENYAIINKELLQSVTMEKNTLDDKFGKQIKKEKIKNGERYYKLTEILGILHTIYHEIRHQKQQQHSENYNLDDLSYYYSAYEIINNNNEFDYKTNYKCYEIEKDANYYAWEDIEKLIKTYMPEHNIERTMKNILNHKLKEELEQMTGIRQTKNNQKYLSSLLLIKYLDEKIKDNPHILNTKYKQLLQFYNWDGTSKRMIDLLKISLIFNYRDFYFNQLNYRSNFPLYKLNQRDIRLSSKKELQTMINNIKILVTTAREKMNKICDRVKKFDTSGSDVEGNIQNYYNFSVYLSNIVNELLILYPDLIKELPIKNSIETINANIEMINNNSLVRKTIGTTNKISKIGRR
jgi:hypothetical protein